MMIADKTGLQTAIYKNILSNNNKPRLLLFSHRKYIRPAYVYAMTLSPIVYRHPQNKINYYEGKQIIHILLVLCLFEWNFVS